MSELSEAHIADLQHMLPSGHWDISGSWNPKLYQSSTAQYLSKAYWDMLDAKVTSREHWNPISLDLSFGHSLGQPKPESMVELYNEAQKLTTVTTLRIRQLFHNVDLWHNLGPHWLTLRHLSLEFRTPCPQMFFKCLSQMSRLEVLQLEFLVSPEKNRIKLDLTTGLTTLSLGLPLTIPFNGCSLDRVGLCGMDDLKRLILYAPTMTDENQVSPDWLHTLSQFTCLEKLEWHYISSHDFCALGPYLPTSLTDLVLTGHTGSSQHHAKDVAHQKRIYGCMEPLDDIRDRFCMFNPNALIGPLIKLPHLRTATLPDFLDGQTPPKAWFKWLSRSSFIKVPDFIWKYCGLPTILPRMTSLLELNLKDQKCIQCNSEDKILRILPQMTQLTRLEISKPVNTTIQQLKRLEWLSTISDYEGLDTLIWPDLKFVELEYDSHPVNWPPMRNFLQRHTSLVELSLHVSDLIAADDHFWPVLSQLALLTALKCMINRRGEMNTLAASVLPPTLKSLIWKGCGLVIPDTHLVLEKAELDGKPNNAFCQRNSVRNRTLEEWLISLDTDSLTRHWFDG